MTSQVVSMTGIWMQRMATVWLVLSLTDSPFRSSSNDFASQIPILILDLVHVKGFNDIHPAFRFGVGAAHDDDVAQRVHVFAAGDCCAVYNKVWRVDSLLIKST